MTLILDLLLGFLLGVSLAAPPGPVTAIILRRSATSVASGLQVGFGAMTADLIMLVGAVILGREFDLERYRFYFFVLGSGVIFIIAYLILRSDGKETEVKHSGSYVTGFIVGISNPFQVIWWLTSGIAFYIRFGINIFYLLFLGTTVWVLFLSYVTNRATRAYGERAVRFASYLSIIILVAFGSYLIYGAITSA